MRMLPVLLSLSLVACGTGEDTSDTGEDTAQDTGEDTADCTEDDTQDTADACGLNDRGTLTEICTDGAWVEDSCDDPDECTDAATDTEACWAANGSRDLVCEDGAWVASDCAVTEPIRVSVHSDGTAGNAHSFGPAMAADGRFVAFVSSASNLGGTDTNSSDDVFVHDLETQTTTLVSVATTGNSGNASATDPSISADGRYIVFMSDATDLVAGDDNGFKDAFLRDMQTSTTTKISKAGGATSVAISADGNTIALSTRDELDPNDNNNPSFTEIYLTDRTTSTFYLVPVPVDGYAAKPALSADGQVVVYTSNGIVPTRGNVPNLSYVHTRGTSTFSPLATQLSDGRAIASDRHALSGDGTVATFASNGTDLVTGDTNAKTDVFMHTVASAAIERISVNTSGSQSDNNSQNSSINHDGTLIAFESAAILGRGNVVSVTNDIHVRDLAAGTTKQISLNTQGQEPNGSSERLSLSGSGKQVAFGSYATDLISDDTNGFIDVFVFPVD
ncbi:MAG: PD40 domain-containing protein [Proteobacteria bacterium]|nr:PD40 domain-containing protein [Pseudomonadota bacterium]